MIPRPPRPDGSLCYNGGVGTLFLVATPIGNLEDITLRALRILGAAILIAAEDTRRTRTLLAHYAIRTPLLSYHAHNQQARLPEVLRALDQGDVALVSDAGTPGLSDPGDELVRAALAAGHAVSPVPGPAAPVAALAASGFPGEAFVFLGYLPRRAAERRRLLEQTAGERRTLLAFEVPHRLRAALDDLIAALGPERPAVAARELTKLHEEFVRGSLGELAQTFASRAPRGEFCLVIAGAPAPAAWEAGRVRQALAAQRAAGASRAQAARRVAAASGWDTRALYRMAEEER